MDELKLIVMTISLSVSTYISYKQSECYGWKGEVYSIATAILSIVTALFGALTFIKILGIW